MEKERNPHDEVARNEKLEEYNLIETMKFRPCIDLHEGCVKQIVGSTLTDDAADKPQTNFSTDRSAADYAEMYKRDGLTGGHVIMLGKGNDAAALSALKAFPKGMQVGGGITPENAQQYLDAGASHVIVTSYVFRNGQIDFARLEELLVTVGAKNLVLDLSCRKKAGEDPSKYYVVTDRWQKYTDFEVSEQNLQYLANCCDEFLVHGVDVEGMRVGVMEDLVEKLGKWSPIPVTYAGGARSLADLELVERLGGGKVDLTVGSALDVFGGDLSYSQVVKWHYAHLFSTEEELDQLENKELEFRCRAAKASIAADEAAMKADKIYRETFPLE